VSHPSLHTGHRVDPVREPADHAGRVDLYAARIAAGQDIYTGEPLAPEDAASCDVNPRCVRAGRTAARAKLG